MAKLFGAALSDLILSVHRQHGTTFHLGRKLAQIRPGEIVMDDGARFDAGLVLVGIGVSPRVDLAERPGSPLGMG